MSGQTSSCPVCDARSSRALYRGLCRCLACSHVWAEVSAGPGVGAGELARLYGRAYFFGEEYSNYLEDRAIIQKNFRRRLRTLQKFLTPRHRRLVEVGCAYGLFLQLARPLFETVEGIDISEDAVRYASSELGLQATCGDLLDVSMTAGREFDVACLWDTIEHLTRPRLYVQTLGEHMRRGALLAVTTGDIGSLNARMQRSRWRLIHPPTHLQYFTRASMATLLERCGFKIRHLECCGFWRSLGGMLHNTVALKWHRPRLAERLKTFVPASLDLYVNLFDIMYVIAERE